jgi:hypothetical protein
MAIFGAQITLTGEPLKLTDYVPDSFNQLDIQASPDNADNVFLCNSDGDVVGTLLPGKSWGTKGSSISLDGDLYISGTNGEVASVLWVL